MGTKNNPGQFDCHANAEPDEPMFILLARDLMAPTVVDMWASLRKAEIDAGRKPASDLAMVEEAYECAMAMRTWRKINRPG